MRHTPVMVVHCGASHVACARFAGGPGNLVVERFATRSVGFGESTEDDWLAAVGAALRELLQGERPCGRCVIGLPGHMTFNHAFRVPAVSPWERRKIIAFERRQGMSAKVEKMVWSHALMGQNENGQDMMLAVAKRRIIEAIGAQIRSTGWYPTAVLPAWLALRLAIDCRPVPAAGAMVLSVGSRSSQFVCVGTRGCFVRTLAVGGDMVTQKLAEELRMDPAAAEALKLRGFEVMADPAGGERERAAGQRATDQFVRRLCAEILRLPPMLAAEGGGHPPVLWLTGGGARLQGLPAALAERLQLRVERWDLLRHCGLAESAPPSLGQTAEGVMLDAADATIAHLVGLVSYATKGPRQGGNLLPRSFRWETFACRRWPFLATAALIAVGVCLAPILRLHNIAGEVRRQTVEAETALSVLRQVEAQNRANLGRLAECNRRIATLGRLANARTGWIMLFDDLQQRFAGVQDVWLDRLRVLQPDSTESSGAQPETMKRSKVNLPIGAAEQPVAAKGTRLLIEGRLIDPKRLAGGGGDEPSPKAESLVAVVRTSPLVVAVEQDRFVGSRPGIWRFEITLRLAPDIVF